MDMFFQKRLALSANNAFLLKNVRYVKLELIILFVYGIAINKEQHSYKEFYYSKKSKQLRNFQKIVKMHILPTSVQLHILHAMKV